MWLDYGAARNTPATYNYSTIFWQSFKKEKRKAFGFVGGGGVWVVRFGHEWWVCKGGNHGGHGSHAARGWKYTVECRD